jgi:DNA-directed RNA polymerase specialized sigma24 family protein
LHYIEDRSVRDVAGLLGIAEGTVKATLAKARATLARTMTREG